MEPQTENDEKVMLDKYVLIFIHDDKVGIKHNGLSLLEMEALLHRAFKALPNAKQSKRTEGDEKNTPAVAQES